MLDEQGGVVVSVEVKLLDWTTSHAKMRTLLLIK